MSFLGLCRGSLSNRTIAAATLQPLRTKNASDEAFWGFLLVSIWFMYGKSWCVCVCVCGPSKCQSTQRIVRNINPDTRFLCDWDIRPFSCPLSWLSDSCKGRSMAPVTEVPLSLTQARSRPTYGVRISLSRIDDHLARAIVIFSLSRGTYCCGCCCCCCCSYPPVLPSRPESTS